MKLLSFRPIIEGKVGNKEAYFLLDTGSNLAFLDASLANEYGLEYGPLFPDNIIGAGGKVEQSYFCNSTILIEDRNLNLFVLTNLELIRASIKKETGITILGIISYTQMKSLGMILNLQTLEVNFS